MGWATGLSGKGRQRRVQELSVEGNGPGSESNSVPHLADDLGQNTGLCLCLSFFIYTLELLRIAKNGAHSDCFEG